jgi:hypothetical protein
MYFAEGGKKTPWFRINYDELYPHPSKQKDPTSFHLQGLELVETISRL